MNFFKNNHNLSSSLEAKDSTITIEEIFYLIYPRTPKGNVQATLETIQAKKILCLSDTNDYYIDDNDQSNSIAHEFSKQCAKLPIEIIQADNYDISSDENYEKGSYLKSLLPQPQGSPRREYAIINNSEFKASNSPKESHDLILGRSLLCCCDGSDHSCGGIENNHKAQADFLGYLLNCNPKLAVITSNGLSEAQSLPNYRKTKEELIKACDFLAKINPHYEFLFVDNFIGLKPGFQKDKSDSEKSTPKLENGHAVIMVRRDTNLKITHLPETIISFETSTEVPKLTRNVSG